MTSGKSRDVENLGRELCASFDAVAAAMRNCADMVSGFSKLVARLPPDVLEEAINSTVPQNGKRKRKAREKKDPNQPKRPTSAYILFQNEVRKFYQDKMTGHPYSEVMAEISKQWKELPEEKKNVYKQKVEAEKLVYGERMREFKKQNEPPVAASVTSAPPKKSAAPQNGAASTVKSSTEESDGSEDDNESEGSEGSEEESDEEENPPVKKKTKSGK